MNVQSQESKKKSVQIERSVFVDCKIVASVYSLDKDLYIMLYMGRFFYFGVHSLKYNVENWGGGCSLLDCWTFAMINDDELNILCILTTQYDLFRYSRQKEIYFV